MMERRLMLRTIFASLWLLVGISALSAEEKSATPVMPTEITLTNGVVLHKVSVVRWSDNYVVLRHAGGADPIRYENIADPKPDVIRAIKAGATAPAQSSQSKPAQVQSRVISGQVFVTTQGAGAYKFSGAKVMAYSADDYDRALSSETGNLPLGFRRSIPFEQDRDAAKAWLRALQDYKQVASSQTDADGKFTLFIPPETPVFLVCYTERLAGYNHEYDLWVVKVGETDRVDLNNHNQWIQPE